MGDDINKKAVELTMAVTEELVAADIYAQEALRIEAKNTPHLLAFGGVTGVSIAAYRLVFGVASLSDALLLVGSIAVLSAAAALVLNDRYERQYFERRAGFRY